MAESPSSLKVHEIYAISPPPETPSITLPFTFFDALWLRFPPVERLFFYSFPTTSLFHTTILPNLKHSLSLTLHHFPPLAATITWPLHSPLPFLTYTSGNTISFTFAESNADFNTLSSNLSEVNHHRQNLTPHLTISKDEASVLALQLTLFPNQGFSIGITTHHAALDGKSSTLFMKSWAYICSHLNTSSEQELLSSLPKHLTPSFDRSAIRDPLGIAGIYAESWLSFGGATGDRSLNVWEDLGGNQTDLVKGLFELTALDIKKLKKLAESKVVGVGEEEKKKKNIRVTSFTVTCAYLLSCAVKAEEPSCERVPFIFTVDCRARLDPPIPGTYFGNSVVSVMTMAKRDELLGEDAFFRSVEGISDELNAIEGDVLKGADSWFSKVQSVMSEGPRIFSVAGSPRFEVYGVDFGWGRPKKVDVTSVDKTGAFCLSESRDRSGGIQIGLSLKKVHMEKFSTLFAQGLHSLE